MNQKHLILIEDLKEEIKKSQKIGPGKRFSKKIKDKVRFLFSEGITVKELKNILPISVHSIREWTKKIPMDHNDTHFFREVSVAQPQALTFTIKHSSGFFIEVNDIDSLNILLMRIKST